MNLFFQLKNLLFDIAQDLEMDCDKSILEKNFSIEIPPINQTKADLATNIAMILASMLKKNPLELAQLISTYLLKYDYIEKVEVAKPGFLNLYIKKEKWCESLSEILMEEDFDTKDLELNLGKVNIEYVSANPTGPLHIGHARGAIYGESLANLLIYCKVDVTREYYINDAGAQVDILTQSLYLRYRNIALNQDTQIPAGFIRVLI